jgi:glycosyltransferase involved in cell wall biosynthesis
MSSIPDSLRVALVAGSLGQGGAEKQLIYLTSALLSLGARLKICCLTQGEYFEDRLDKIGIKPIYIGKYASPLLRLGSLARVLLPFRPHIIQSIHFYTNLYAAFGARFLQCFSIGSIRSNTYNELNSNGAWGPWLLRTPSALIVNSYTARENAVRVGVNRTKIEVLSNVIDLPEFDQRQKQHRDQPVTRQQIRVGTIARLIPSKRLECFLQAFAYARQEIPNLQGVIIGDGPEKTRLESMAADIGLHASEMLFTGRRDNIPELLAEADLFVLTSEYEGFPNVILEAMASRLPVVTTPAGDAARVVKDGVTGFVVPFNDAQETARRIVQLAGSAELREQFGNAGRWRVEQEYGYDGFPQRLVSVYQAFAAHEGNPALSKALSTIYANS